MAARAEFVAALLLWGMAPVGAWADGAGLCHDGEVVYFSCEVAGRTPGRFMSLCGQKGDGAGLQYRFGRVGSPELVFPEPGGFSAFRFSGYARFQVSRIAVAFSREGVTYRVFDDHESESGDESIRQGVMVTPPGNQARSVTLPCRGQAISRLGDLESRLPADGGDPLVQ